MSLGCLSAFSKKRHAVVHNDAPMSPPRASHLFQANGQTQHRQSALRTGSMSSNGSNRHHSHPGTVPGSCTHSHSTRTKSSGSRQQCDEDIVEVLQDFVSEQGDELTVRAGQRLRVLYVEGDWMYVMTMTDRCAPDMCGFVPTHYCHRVQTGGDRSVKFAAAGPHVLANPRVSSSSLAQGNGVEQCPGSNTYDLVSDDPLVDGVAFHHAADESSTSDYVVLRSPTKTEQGSVNGGFPHAAKVLYNFSDDAPGHACVRRGEMVAALGLDAATPDWTRIQRRNGQTGLVPSCFLQAEGKGSLLAQMRADSDSNSSCSTVTSQRRRPSLLTPFSQSSSSSVIQYPTHAAPKAEVATWVQDTARYAAQDSPGHSTASSTDSGYGLSTSQYRHRSTPTSVTPPLAERRESLQQRRGGTASAARPSGTSHHSTSGGKPSASSSSLAPQASQRRQSSRTTPPTVDRSGCASVSPDVFHCTPTSSYDSGHCQDSSPDFPPPPDSVMYNTGSRTTPPNGNDSSRRKLAHRRQLGRQNVERPQDIERPSSTVDEVADQLVHMATLTKSPEQPLATPLPKSNAAVPPPVAPEPQRPNNRPTHATEQSTPASDCRSSQDELASGDACLLVISNFASDGVNKLSVQKGDVVYGDTSLAVESRGWVWVYCPAKQEHGFIPAVYTQPCNADECGGGVVTDI